MTINADNAANAGARTWVPLRTAFRYALGVVEEQMRLESRRGATDMAGAAATDGWAPTEAELSDLLRADEEVSLFEDNKPVTDRKTRPVSPADKAVIIAHLQLLEGLHDERIPARGIKVEKSIYYDSLENTDIKRLPFDVWRNCIINEDDIDAEPFFVKPVPDYKRSCFPPVLHIKEGMSIQTHAIEIDKKRVVSFFNSLRVDAPPQGR